MSLLASLMYRALAWKERQRAKRGLRPENFKNGAARAEHLETGERGETLAYWFLRQAGYTIVARNRRAQNGELDLVGWDGPTLAFVEVKTRTSLEGGPPEAAVTREKQKRVVRAAREHLRRLPRPPASYRFDVVSVFWDAEQGLQVRLTKDAFRAK